MLPNEYYLPNESIPEGRLSYWGEEKRKVYKSLIEALAQAECFYDVNKKLKKIGDYQDSLQTLHYLCAGAPNPQTQAARKDFELAISADIYKKTSQLLEQEEFWNKLKERLLSKENSTANVDALYRKWKLQKTYAHLTLQGLIETSRILNSLKNHILAAKVEFDNYHSQLPRITREHYLEFLALAHHEILVAEISMTEIMLARWEQAKQKKDLKAHDLMASVVDQLNSLGAKLKFDNRQWQAKPLDNAICVEFYTYIKECHDTNPLFARRKLILENHKERLKNLMAVTPSSMLTVLHINNKACLVPAALQNLIPVQSPWFSWLFNGNDFRHQFFQDPTVADLLLHLSVGSPHWNAKDELQKLLVKNLQTSTYLLTMKFNHFYHRQTQKFLAQWNEFLLDQQRKIIIEQIEIMEKHHQLGFVHLQDDVLEKMLDDSKEYHAAFAHTDPLRDRLYQARAKIIYYAANKIHSADQMNLSLQAIRQLLEGKALAKSDYATLTSFVDRLILNKENLAAFRSNYQPMLKALTHNTLALIQLANRYLSEAEEENIPSRILLQLNQLALVTKHLAPSQELLQASCELMQSYRLYLFKVAMKNLAGLYHDNFIEIENILIGLMPHDSVLALKDIRLAMIANVPIETFINEEEKIKLKFSSPLDRAHQLASVENETYQQLQQTTNQSQTQAVETLQKLEKLHAHSKKVIHSSRMFRQDITNKYQQLKSIKAGIL